jgi:hypothetical protein
MVFGQNDFEAIRQLVFLDLELRYGDGLPVGAKGDGSRQKDYDEAYRGKWARGFRTKHERPPTTA